MMTVLIWILEMFLGITESLFSFRDPLPIDFFSKTTLMPETHRTGWMGREGCIGCTRIARRTDSLACRRPRWRHVCTPCYRLEPAILFLFSFQKASYQWLGSAASPGFPMIDGREGRGKRRWRRRMNSLVPGEERAWKVRESREWALRVRSYTRIGFWKQRCSKGGATGEP